MPLHHPINPNLLLTVSFCSWLSELFISWSAYSYSLESLLHLALARTAPALAPTQLPQQAAAPAAESAAQTRSPIQSLRSHLTLGACSTCSGGSCVGCRSLSGWSVCHTLYIQRVSPHCEDACAQSGDACAWRPCHRCHRGMGAGLQGEKNMFWVNLLYETDLHQVNWHINNSIRNTW